MICGGTETDGLVGIGVQHQMSSEDIGFAVRFAICGTTWSVWDWISMTLVLTIPGIVRIVHLKLLTSFQYDPIYISYACIVHHTRN